MKTNSRVASAAAAALALAGGLLGAAPVSGRATTIELGLEPSSATVTIGGTVSVDLVVRGLDPSPGGPSLGGFFVDVAFDPGLLVARSVAFGSELNVSPLGLLGQFADWGTAGWVHLDEISEFLPDDLNAFQPSGFRLATITFEGLASGVSLLSIDAGASSLSNEDGLLSLDFVTSDARLEVVSRVVPDSGGGVGGYLLGAIAVVLVGTGSGRDRRRRARGRGSEVGCDAAQGRLAEVASSAVWACCRRSIRSASCLADSRRSAARGPARSWARMRRAAG